MTMRGKYTLSEMWTVGVSDKNWSPARVICPALSLVRINPSWSLIGPPPGIPGSSLAETDHADSQPAGLLLQARGCMSHLSYQRQDPLSQTSGHGSDGSRQMFHEMFGLLGDLGVAQASLDMRLILWTLFWPGMCNEQASIDVLFSVWQLWLSWAG